MPIPHSIQEVLARVNVNATTGCWEWTGNCQSSSSLPYGRAFSKTDGRSKSKLVHRIAYELVYGPIPDGMRVLHHCDNPPCCNPDHLFLGSDVDNMADRDKKGRTARGDRHGARIHYAEFAERCRRRAVEQPDTYCRGEKNGRAKLTAELVAEIRRRYATRDGSLRSLAREFGVTYSNISRIVHGKSWKNL